jgi:hypothetical protein
MVQNNQISMKMSAAAYGLSPFTALSGEEDRNLVKEQ